MFRVRSYKWHTEQKEHKGHNRAAVKAGQTVYVIQDDVTGLYFYYAYLNPNIAELVCNKFMGSHVNIEVNFRRNPICVTARTSMD